MSTQTLLAPGQKVQHPQFGDGVVIETPINGYVKAFFTVGERRVPIESLRQVAQRNDLIIDHVSGVPEQLRTAWLTYQSYVLPLLDEAPMLTAAKVDLLPHQVVLTHRTAMAAPRRFLIADEVGLGKTIETALILRELASRGELKRALMVVPAGLLDNWHRELNHVFHLNFEIFGSDGDVTDRKSNAFAKHDRLIASVDTLKRSERIKRLLEAPKWDLVVFDEAHHLNAYRNGSKITRTENYKLAEALKSHCRDMLLLSATPHQGDHFRFWMLIHLLDNTLYRNAEEMLDNRHRLNAVVIRRTKADACKPDGSPLFMRRLVNTESFSMSAEESAFYEQLRSYLQEGFALAKREGKQARALGFVMSVFQKIAASSFAAVKRTLRRRLINLTIHESIVRDRQLDVRGRDALHEAAKQLIREEYGLASDPIGTGEVDRILAEQKLRLLKKLDESELSMLADPSAGEITASTQEDAASASVSFALPEERSIIQSLLKYFPEDRETKIKKLLSALDALWQQDPNEKVVIFATYLGTVDLLEREINTAYPSQGVVVLRGGDHSAKLTAERKFKQQDGPRVLVCTAAGREGINLQFSRILFNFDLPWNPMDIEQRIGRIHRYGQKHTAQIYNFVLADTIEGKIFLLLNDKLNDIARAVGKLDENGNIAEDLRSQILGQLAERVNYDKLYQQALSDPELKRTRFELEQALANAQEARVVVFELFQDLEGFSIEDYKPFADITAAMNKLVAFTAASLQASGKQLRRLDETTYRVVNAAGEVEAILTTNRNAAKQESKVDLLGLDYPLIQEAINRWRNVAPQSIACSLQADPGSAAAIVSIWLVESTTNSGQTKSHFQPIAVDLNGKRVPELEHDIEAIFTKKSMPSKLSSGKRRNILSEHIEPMLHRELQYKGIVEDQSSFVPTLIGWLELTPDVSTTLQKKEDTAALQPELPLQPPIDAPTPPALPDTNTHSPVAVSLEELLEYITESREIQAKPAASEAKLLLDHAQRCGYNRDEMNQFMFTEFGITGKTFAELFTWEIMSRAAKAFAEKHK